MRGWTSIGFFSLWIGACGVTPGSTPLDAAAGDGGGGAVAGTGAILGRVRAVGASAGLAGVSVRLQGGASAVTDAHGWFVLSGVAESPRATLRVEHPGYADAVKPVAVDGGAVAEVEITLARFTASVQIDAQMGGRVDDGAGGVAVIPANALVRADGQRATGMVTVSIAPIDPSEGAQMDAFPGDFSASRSDGSGAELETFVPMLVSAKQGGASLELAAGMSAELSLPVPRSASERAPERIELWRLDPSTGRWQEEGTAAREADPSRAGAVRYRASAPRLGWWNADRPMQTTCVRGCVRSADDRPFARAQVRGEGVDYFGRSSAVGSPSTGCFAMNVKRSARVAITASSGGVTSTRREVMTSDEVLRAPGAGDRCQDLGVIVLAAPVPDPCAAGMSLCAERCVDRQRDPSHCGACGNACGAAQRCVEGACATTDAGVTPDVIAQDVLQDSGFDAPREDVIVDAGARDAPIDAPVDAGARDVPIDAPIDAPVDAGARDVPVDTGSPCAAGQTLCGAACVDTSSSTAHCGRCNSSCSVPVGGSASCASGSCRMLCPTGRSLCGEACSDPLTDAFNCGACGTACGTGRACVAGACAAPETPFRVVSLSTASCAVHEHAALTGGSAGGVAVSGEEVLHVGASGTARLDLGLRSATANASNFPALVGTTTGGAYTFASGTTPLGATGGVADGLIPVDFGGTLGTSRRIALSTPLTITAGTGFFAGQNRVVLHVGGRVQDIDIPSGRVTDRGALTLPSHSGCAGLGYWGVAENYLGQLYLDLIVSRTSIARVSVPGGVVTTLARFSDLGASCGFTVWNGRWFLASDGPSEFASSAGTGAAHVVGCSATTDQPIVVSGDTLDAGRSFTCAIRANATVACWGANAMGQLGDNSTAPQRLTPVSVQGASLAVSVATGTSHACALQSSGRVQCWGANASGQLGNNSTTARIFATTVPSLTDVVEIAAGGAHSCARLRSGAVMCWGANDQGQLGDGSTTTRLVPTAVSGLTDARSIVAGASHTCATRSFGSVVCWGSNADGRLGDGTTTNRAVPTAVSGLFEVSSVAAGQDFTCARWGGGFVSCWGANQLGQLGDGTNLSRPTPARVGSFSNAQSLTAGAQHACLRSASNAVMCWGAGTSGQLGDGELLNRNSPVGVTSLAEVSQLAAGADHSCARTLQGDLRCWGANTSGQLGDNSTTARSAPVSVSGL